MLLTSRIKIKMQTLGQESEAKKKKKEFTRDDEILRVLP